MAPYSSSDSAAPAMPDSAWLGSARLGSARLGSARRASYGHRPVVSAYSLPLRLTGQVFACSGRPTPWTLPAECPPARPPSRRGNEACSPSVWLARRTHARPLSDVLQRWGERCPSAKTDRPPRPSLQATRRRAEGAGHEARPLRLWRDLYKTRIKIKMMTSSAPSPMYIPAS